MIITQIIFLKSLQKSLNGSNRLYKIFIRCSSVKIIILTQKEKEGTYQVLKHLMDTLLCHTSLLSSGEKIQNGKMQISYSIFVISCVENMVIYSSNKTIHVIIVSFVMLQASEKRETLFLQNRAPPFTLHFLCFALRGRQ